MRSRDNHSGPNARATPTLIIPPAARNIQMPPDLPEAIDMKLYDLSPPGLAYSAGGHVGQKSNAGCSPFK